jgi:hypothetical protein
MNRNDGNIVKCVKEKKVKDVKIKEKKVKEKKVKDVKVKEKKVKEKKVKDVKVKEKKVKVRKINPTNIIQNEEINDITTVSHFNWVKNQLVGMIRRPKYSYYESKNFDKQNKMKCSNVLDRLTALCKTGEKDEFDYLLKSFRHGNNADITYFLTIKDIEKQDGVGEKILNLYEKSKNGGKCGYVFDPKVLVFWFQNDMFFQKYFDKGFMLTKEIIYAINNNSDQRIISNIRSLRDEHFAIDQSEAEKYITYFGHHNNFASHDIMIRLLMLQQIVPTKKMLRNAASHGSSEMLRLLVSVGEKLDSKCLYLVINNSCAQILERSSFNLDSKSKSGEAKKINSKANANLEKLKYIVRSGVKLTDKIFNLIIDKYIIFRYLKYTAKYHRIPFLEYIISETGYKPTEDNINSALKKKIWIKEPGRYNVDLKDIYTKINKKKDKKNKLPANILK